MRRANLILKSGEIFPGFVVNDRQTPTFGEVVFNTGMVGYVESMTDPSYYKQILTFTYPIIGNYGVPASHYWESDKIQVSAIVVSELAQVAAHHQLQKSLTDWCTNQDVPILFGVDTRALTHSLREHGVIAGAITNEHEKIGTFHDINSENLVAKVSISQPKTMGNGRYHVIVVDCGIKQNILRHLLQLPIRITQVPYDYDYTEEDCDGVFLSNGPGDPALCQTTIDHCRKMLTREKPMFGICLGAQILALAAGASTYKLLYGHRAQNQPCIDLATGRCYLTSENHGYAIDAASLPDDWRVSFQNLNDQTVQGIAHKYLPFRAVQFHPEAAPGPTDSHWFFTEFMQLLRGVANDTI